MEKSLQFAVVFTLYVILALNIGFSSSVLSKDGSTSNEISQLENLTGLTAEEIKHITKKLKYVQILLRDRTKNKWHSMPINKKSIPKNVWVDGGNVKMVIHGYCGKPWQTSEDSIDEQGVFDFGISLANHSLSDNVLVVNWTILATGLMDKYPFIAKSTRFVGEGIAKFLVGLHTKSLFKDWDKVHVMGFSLGAHVSGVIGNKVQEFSPGDKIGRLTGLDPAGPMFDVNGDKLPEDLSGFLDKSDGKFVDIIHTNMKTANESIVGHLGSCVQAGHADLYPDGGVSQDSCNLLQDITKACSHLASVVYMKKSLTKSFVSCPCNDYETYKEGNCNCTLESKGVLMGLPCSSRASGKYFLTMR